MVRSGKVPQRPFDVVLYGATGFVGRQTARYFAEHATGLRWAIAGRSAKGLEALRKSLDLPQSPPGVLAPEIIVADAADATSLNQLAAQTRVVLSTAGPYARHGSLLVAACVRHRTHYVDITGETPWVRTMIDRHHNRAAQDGTRIVPGCGFDSVPSDLGAWLVAQSLLRRHGQRCVSVKACFTISGGLNGGTFASLMNVLDTGEKRRVDDPFLLNPRGTVPADKAAHADPTAPSRDPDFDAWVGPFVMGPINTRVVRRSAALLVGDSAFAPNFSYQEYMHFGRGAKAAITAAGVSAGMLLGQSAMAFKPVRRAIGLIAPAPGEGPSEVKMDRGSFRCDLFGVGEKGSVVRGRISGRGDPGNRATTIFVCEAALALALDTDQLPGGRQLGGVLTPSIAFGDVLAQRLRAAGMTVEA